MIVTVALFIWNIFIQPVCNHKQVNVAVAVNPGRNIFM